MRMILHRWSVLLVAILAGLLGVGCAAPVLGGNGTDPGNDLATTGVLLGRVTQGPMVPVERVDHAVPPGSVVGAQILISDVDGNQVATLVTDEQGRYRVDLAPGSYRVDMVRVGRFGLSKDLPATVTVYAGQESRLDVRVDTGIR